MKRLLVTLLATLLGGFFMPALAEPEPRVVQLRIVCTETMGEMAALLKEKFSEQIVAVGEFSPEAMFAIFASPDRSSSSIIILKNGPNDKSACLAWSGRASPGNSFVVFDEPPVEPEPEGTGT